MNEKSSGQSLQQGGSLTNSGPHQNEEGPPLSLGRQSQEFLLFPITPRWTNHFRDCLSPFVYVNGCQKRTLAARRTPTPLLLLLVLLGSIQYFATLYKKVLKKNWYNFSLVLKRCSSMYVGASASISDESRYYTTHVLEQPSKNGLSTTQFRIFFNIENLDSCCAPQQRIYYIACHFGFWDF